MRYVWRDGWVPAAAAAPRPMPARSNFPTPGVISDLDPFRSPVDGSVLGGRAQRRAHMTEHGLGDANDGVNEKPTLTKAELKRDIKDAYDQAGAGKGAHSLPEAPDARRYAVDS